MRIIVVATAWALAACSPPSPAPNVAAEGSAARARQTDSAVMLDVRAIPGQWSFDRTCGVYDLVLGADSEALYFDYSDASQVVAYAGRWSLAGNRIVLTLNKSGEEGSQLGETEIYHVDVGAAVTDDLAGSFGAENGEMRNINARRCPQEDRD